MFVANGPMALQSHIQEHSDQSHKNSNVQAVIMVLVQSGTKTDILRNAQKTRKGK